MDTLSTLYRVKPGITARVPMTLNQYVQRRMISQLDAWADVERGEDGFVIVNDVGIYDIEDGTRIPLSIHMPDERGARLARDLYHLADDADQLHRFNLALADAETGQ